jgi:hypothetical protein
MVTSSSTTAAFTAGGWDGEGVAGFGFGAATGASAGIEIRVGSGGGVVACVVSVLAGPKSGSGSGVEVAATGTLSSGLRVGVDAVDSAVEFGAVACIGSGGVVSVRAGLESGVCGGSGVTKSPYTKGGAVNEGAATLCSTAGLRVDFDAGDELEAAGTGDLIRVLAKITSSSVGVEGTVALCPTGGL